MSEEQVQLRRCRQGDLAGVGALIHSTIDACYPSVYPPRAVDFFKRFHSDSALLRRSQGGYVVVVDGGNGLLATGALVDGEITGVFVDPVAQGRGLGGLVMGALEDEAAAGGLDSVTLSVSLPSRGFYEHRGYHVVESRSLDVGDGETLDYFEAVKQLRES